jgi:hypothetical protein
VQGKGAQSGVFGWSGNNSSSWNSYSRVGVQGDTGSTGGIGVLGTVDAGYALVATNNSPVYYAADIYNQANGPALAAGGTAFAVYIDGLGNLAADGTISGAAKNFRIDHPLDPANKFLNHTSIESSEMLNLYTGNAVLGADGSATVSLPEWFTALNRDFRYQLTPVGRFAQLYIAEEVTANKFRIAGGRAGMKVSWQITGVRHDAYAKAHPMVVEPEKQGDERGHYLHPDAFGQPAELGITAARRSKLLPRVSGKSFPTTAKTPGAF